MTAASPSSTTKPTPSQPPPWRAESPTTPRNSRRTRPSSPTPRHPSYSSLTQPEPSNTDSPRAPPPATSKQKAPTPLLDRLLHLLLPAGPASPFNASLARWLLHPSMHAFPLRHSAMHASHRTPNMRSGCPESSTCSAVVRPFCTCQRKRQRDIRHH